MSDTYFIEKINCAHRRKKNKIIMDFRTVKTEAKTRQLKELKIRNKNIPGFIIIVPKFLRILEQLQAMI